MKSHIAAIVTTSFLLTSCAIGPKAAKSFSDSVGSLSSSIDNLDTFRDALIIRAQASSSVYAKLYSATDKKCPSVANENVLFEKRHEYVETLSKFAKSIVDVLDTSGAEGTATAAQGFVEGLADVLAFAGLAPTPITAFTGIVVIAAKGAIKIKSQADAQALLEKNRDKILKSIKSLKESLPSGDSELTAAFAIWSYCEQNHFDRVRSLLPFDGNAEVSYAAEYRAFQRDLAVVRSGLKIHKYSTLDEALTKTAKAFAGLGIWSIDEVLGELKGAATDLKTVHDNWIKLRDSL